jgi:hypothetical protein
VKFDLPGLEEPVRREVLAVAAWRRFDRSVVLFHEGEAAGSLQDLAEAAIVELGKGRFTVADAAASRTGSGPVNLAPSAPPSLQPGHADHRALANSST